VLTSLLWRPKWPADTVRTYYVLNVVMTLCFTLFSTLSLVYMATTVGLSPLQMVLVGTVLEAVCFCFEVPTGIVSDLYSRRLSILIGLLLVGGGFLLQGLVPTFAGVLAAQVVWGIGYTFTSGSIEAWLADEIGVGAIGPIFTREVQLSLGATFVAVIGAGALGLVDIRVPMVAGGAGLVLLAGWLALTMPERHFARTPAAERETFAQVGRSFTAGVSMARRSRVVRSFLLISLIGGLSSEAFDRLWTVRVLELDPPGPFDAATPVILFAGITLVGTVISLLSSIVVGRVGPDHVNALHPGGLLACLALVQVAGIIGLALLGNLWVALVAMWVRGAAATVAAPIESAWLNRNVESKVRATVLSMNGQANAIGQVVGGPPLGALANRTSVSTALTAPALILSPIALVYARLRPGVAVPRAEGELDRRT
jgi:DHA3 family tetracycline resistance protein-like MFS transporter